PKALTTDMSVTLGGGQVGVTEQLLDGTEVGATVQQVGGEGVPQGVRVGGSARAVVEDPANVARGEALAPVVEEQRVRGRVGGDEHLAALVDPSAQGGHGGLPERDRALLATLAPHHCTTAVEVEIGRAQGAQLTDPQAASVQDLQHGIVAEPHRTSV